MPHPRNPKLPLRARDVQLYSISEHITEGLLYSMIVFSPWAFGTTQHWSMWAMNTAGYVLGLCLLVKVFIRRLKGYRPPRWDQITGASQPRPLRKQLWCLTLAILIYCLISAVNAAASCDSETRTFTYHHYLRWLPHTFDKNRTWFAFWNYLGLACAFWALEDWLPGKSGGEERAARQPALSGGISGPLLPARMRRLLLLLCINGGLVGLEAIIQRLEGSGRLLFLIKPQINAQALSQFGPYHYRANASAFFNLIWPVCLGFWLILHRTAGSRNTKHHLLLLSALIIAASPIISTSRGGALVTVGIIILAACSFLVVHFLLTAHRQEKKSKRQRTLIILFLFFIASLAFGLGFGWKALKPRMAQIPEGFEGREEMYNLARPMASDYPVFGTGPGTFESVFQLYRTSTETYWPAQLHNDWLETRITFGWTGSLLIALALLTVLLRWFLPGGIHGGRRFMILIWLALGGCLVHARFDFPFQIYSILFLFLVLCALAFNLSRRPPR